MPRCSITYELIDKGLYSNRGLRLFNPALKGLQPFYLDNEAQIKEAQKRMTKMSIAGVQPKLSAKLSIKNKQFKLVDKNGSYILKPSLQSFPEVAENEDLTMRLANICGIEVPVHGLIYAKDDSKLFAIKRFDRIGNSGKVHVEDFAQISGMTRDTKYSYSMEKVVSLIDLYCTFPVIEKAKLFRRVIFCWITGNEDMHLKNFSIIYREGKIELSPAYDLLNTSIVLPSVVEEIALPLRGIKSKLSKGIFFKYFAKERMNLPDKIILSIEKEIRESIPKCKKMIRISFLSENKKEEYLELLSNRITRLGW